MFTSFRHAFGVMFVLFLASCSGGGCGGCGGTTSLPGGFPKDETIANAASVRLSRPGLDFVEKSLPPLVASIAKAPGGKLALGVPETPISVPNVISAGSLGVDLVGKVCPGGPDTNANPPRCTAEVNIGAATFLIDSVKANAVTIRATIPLQVDDTPIDVDFEPGPALTMHVGYGSSGQCVGADQEKVSVQPKALPVLITLPLVEESVAPRNGYTKIDVNNAVINLDAIRGDDVRLCAKCFTILGFNVCDAVLNIGFLKNFLVNQLKGQLGSQVKGLLADALCQAPSPALVPSCPTGTSPDAADKYCVFDNGKGTPQEKCVSTLLGTDAHVDLGGLLKSISPGTSGGVDFGLAAGGAMIPAPSLAANTDGRTANGITLGMLGGVVPQPISACVPQARLTVPKGIPMPDEMAPTKADVASTPHVGIALAGRFLDYAFGSAYNSGLLCLGVSSEQFDMLRAGLLSLIVPSLKNLTFEQGDAPAAIATRPQAPPSVKLGGGTNIDTDPLLRITLPQFALDFYVWHLDRYVRVFTFQADLTIPVNLQTGKDPVKNPKGGIIPAIGDIKVANGVVTNAELLLDEPVAVARALQGLLGGLGKQLVGAGLAPIDISSALGSFGLGLEVNTINKLTKNTDDFVGIFASLSKAAGTATVEADTTAKLVSKNVSIEHMQLATMDRAFLPELVVDVASPLDSPNARTIEYSWSIDNGTRSTWSTEKHLVIKDDQLLLQGRHTFKVAARVANESATEDATPAEVPFTIDALAPSVKVEKDGSHATIQAWDVVSSPAALVGRYRLDSTEYGAWLPISDIARIDVGAAETVDVEVKDDEGNVRSVRQELIRGRADGSLAPAGSGCGCSTPGGTQSSNGVLSAVLALAALGFVAYRRRSSRASRASGRTGVFVSSRHAALALCSIAMVAATSQGCSCGGEADAAAVGCGADCTQECKTELPRGLPGSYTSIAKAADGAIWVAGYNDALLTEERSELWGDLVVGKYDVGKQAVDWRTVDGLPDRKPGTCADRARSSWRNGESDSGDNVGLWTSMQISADGKPMVSYYDATNKKLKFAVLTNPDDTNSWKVITLKEQANADIGRYSKMLLVDGKPVIAFLHIEPGNAGKTRSIVILARSSVDVPQEPSDFRFEQVAVEEDNPCAASTCAGGQVCLKTTGACTATISGCTPTDCGSGRACVGVEGKATCVATKGATQTYPDVFGDYISLAQGGGNLGIAVYDRPHGNLVALVQQSEGTWFRTIVDGETGSRKDKTAIDTGDVGVAASLAIDSSGTWHMTYVSGLDETLRYVTVDGGTKPGKAEIVDDGSTADGKPFADGKHVVGDDSAVRIDGDTITVFYQDATVGTLRRAARTKNGATYTWEIRTLQQPNRFAGYWPQIVPGEDRVANFWEQTDRARKSRVGDVTILSP